MAYGIHRTAVLYVIYLSLVCLEKQSQLYKLDISGTIYVNKCKVQSQRQVYFSTSSKSITNVKLLYYLYYLYGLLSYN